MNNQFSINVRAVRRIAYTMMAALLVVAGTPLFQTKKADAAQMTNRSIQMSDAVASGGTVVSNIGSGEDVTYRVSFDAVNTTPAGSLVIDFCSNTPLIGESCTAPTGMDASAVVLSTVTGSVTAAGWDEGTGSVSQVQLEKNSGSDIAGSGSLEVFDLTGIINPSTTGTFYARMYTFANTTYGTYASAASPGNFLDYGGIALTTTALITITARVQENIVFCVSKADPATWTTTGGCDDPLVGSNPPVVELGHISGATKILDAQQVDTDSIYSQINTNATNGAVINLRSNPGGKLSGAPTCGGLSADAGVTCAIPAVGATASAITAGTAALGLFISDSAFGGGGSGATMTPTTIYNDQTNEGPTYFYGLDDTTAQTANSGGLNRTFTGNVKGTFGSTLAKATGPTYRAENVYRFAATAALTTPAGIYTANMTMTATGSF